MIRKAIPIDIDKVLGITKACAIYMIDKNIHQWNEVYPNKKTFLKDVDRNELYVLELKNTIIGCITISTFIDAIYGPVSWLTPTKNNIYIHRLAVHPDYQRNGYAQQLMHYAENYAVKNHYDSIRLDTFSQNHKNLKFYELRGYKKLEPILFPKQSVFPFYCYELIL